TPAQKARDGARAGSPRRPRSLRAARGRQAAPRHDPVAVRGAARRRGRALLVAASGYGQPEIRLPTRTRRPLLRLNPPSGAPPVAKFTIWKSRCVPSNAAMFGTASGIDATPVASANDITGPATFVLAEYSVQPGASSVVPSARLSTNPHAALAGLPMQRSPKVALPSVARSGEPTPNSDGAVGLPQPGPRFTLY